MSERNTPHTDPLSSQVITVFRPDRCILPGSMHPVLATTGANTEQGVVPFRNYPDSGGRFYVDQFNSFQNYHAVPNSGLYVAAPANFYAPCVFPSSSSVDGFGRNGQFVDDFRGFGKRKHVEVPPWNQHNITEAADSTSADFLSLTSGVRQQEQPQEIANLANPRSFDRHQERGYVEIAEGSMSRPIDVSLLPEFAYYPQANHALHATYFGQPFRPAWNVWTPHYSPENYICHMPYHNMNNYPVAYLQGASGALQLSNMGVRPSPDPSSSANAGVLLNPTALPYFQYHQSPVNTRQLQSYSHQAHAPAPSYQHPLNNSRLVGVNASSRGLIAGPVLPQLPPHAAQNARPRQIHHATSGIHQRRLTILSSEDAYGVDDAIDHLQDLRLDVDRMSYEELLALGERMGNVQTGLTEEFITKNLKMGVHNSETTLLSDASTSTEGPKEPESCAICQEDYMDDEIIASLDCGHKYHGKCIKKWLLMKNWCPVCKKAGLEAASNGQ